MIRLIHKNSYWGITIERCFPAGFIILVVPHDELTIIVAKACRTRELSAEQKFTREHWRKQVLSVCGDGLKYFFTRAIFSWQCYEKR